jgi:hypothetical protein
MVVVSIAVVVLLVPVIVVSIVVVVLLVPVIVVSIVVMVVAVAMIVLAAFVVRRVFCGSYEVHGPITGIIFSAMLAPIPRMVGRHMQIDRRWRGRLRFDQHRLRVDQRRPSGVAELNLPIDARCHLSRYNDIDAQIPCAADVSAGERDRGCCYHEPLTHE